jgi:DNA-binding transcriptional regulator YhcF (GntR family)
MRRVIDPTSDRPAYLQIADHLRAAIVKSELAAGAQLLHRSGS